MENLTDALIGAEPPKMPKQPNADIHNRMMGVVYLIGSTFSAEEFNALMGIIDNTGSLDAGIVESVIVDSLVGKSVE